MSRRPVNEMGLFRRAEKPTTDPSLWMSYEDQEAACGVFLTMHQEPGLTVDHGRHAKVYDHRGKLTKGFTHETPYGPVSATRQLTDKELGWADNQLRDYWARTPEIRGLENPDRPSPEPVPERAKWPEAGSWQPGRTPRSAASTARSRRPADEGSRSAHR